MKGKCISPTNMEIYWYGDFYIRIQGRTHSMPPYALIQTNQTAAAKIEFDGLSERGLIKEISKEEFLTAAFIAKNTIESFLVEIENEKKEPKLGHVYEYSGGSRLHKLVMHKDYLEDFEKNPQHYKYLFEKPHSDGDFSYWCRVSYCKCSG